MVGARADIRRPDHIRRDLVLQRQVIVIGQRRCRLWNIGGDGDRRGKCRGGATQRLGERIRLGRSKVWTGEAGRPWSRRALFTRSRVAHARAPWRCIHAAVVDDAGAALVVEVTAAPANARLAVAAQVIGESEARGNIVVISGRTVVRDARRVAESFAHWSVNEVCGSNARVIIGREEPLPAARLLTPG